MTPAVEAFPEVMDLETCARFLQVDRHTVSELMVRDDDPLPHRRLGRRNGVRFLKRAVEGWLSGAADQPPQLRRVV